MIVRIQTLQVAHKQSNGHDSMFNNLCHVCNANKMDEHYELYTCCVNS